MRTSEWEEPGSRDPEDLGGFLPPSLTSCGLSGKNASHSETQVGSPITWGE